MNRKTLMLAAAAVTVIAFGPGRPMRADEKLEAPAAVDKAAEVIAIDAEAKSITIKRPTAENVSMAPEILAVEGKALASLKEFKAGDKVLLTCKEGAPGEKTVTSGDESKTETESLTASGNAKPCVVVEISKAAEE